MHLVFNLGLSSSSVGWYIAFSYSTYSVSSFGFEGRLCLSMIGEYAWSNRPCGLSCSIKFKVTHGFDSIICVLLSIPVYRDCRFRRTGHDCDLSCIVKTKSQCLRGLLILIGDIYLWESKIGRWEYLGNPVLGRLGCLDAFLCEHLWLPIRNEVH